MSKSEHTKEEGRGTVAAGTTSEKTKESCSTHWGASFGLTREELEMRPEGEVGQITICHVSFIL